MIEPTHVVQCGRPASAALAAVIGDAQTAKGDPLAPVTVVVSSNFVGLSLRRLLGSGALASGTRAGIANVSFLTPFRLAEMLAADQLLDRRPITNPVLGAAVRHVLATEPGPYRLVAGHEATEAALAGLFAELSNVDEAGLESMFEEGSAAAMWSVGFYRAVAARLDGFHTERDLAVAAADRPDFAERLGAFGHVVWYLPGPVTSAVGRFLGDALREAQGSSIIVGLTGADDADEIVWNSCAAAGISRPTRPPAVAVPVADRIVSVTDAPEEVREVTRSIVAAIERGVRPDRIGVFYPAPDPYVRIIQHQFAAAELPANGPDRQRLADSVAGRVVLGALDLPAERWRRDRVMALVNTGPLRAGDGWVRAPAWDAITRDAGVVGDLSDWRIKLERYCDVQQRWLDDTDASAEHEHARRGRALDRLHDARHLLTFVESLATMVRTVDDAPSWSERCAAAQALLESLLGSGHQHTGWPEDEQVAFERVEDALVRLSVLDPIDPGASSSAFRRALRTELDVARGRHGRFGQGVVYGPLASADGLDLDHVFVLGAAEGMLPIPRRDNDILPDAVRARSLDQLELKSARLQHQHRSVLTALATAPPGGRTFTFARGDLRSGRRAAPSRWLLDTASSLAGQRVHATDFAALGPDVVDVVGSFASGIRRAGSVATLDQRDLVELAEDFERGAEPADHPLGALVGHGLEMQRARASTRFTPFDGNLSSLPSDLRPGTVDRSISPTQLETWAHCGFRYFLRYVLRVADRDDPERLDDISAVDRGSIVHTALERFIREAIEAGPPHPDAGWSHDQVQRLHAIAKEECAVFEASGRTGRAVSWTVRQDEIADILNRFIQVDNDFRRSARATPSHVELDFGVADGQPVEIALPSGRAIRLRGRADRVDLTDDGGVIVSDYKTGKGMKFDKLSDDPFLAGTGLQLGMYAEGAAQATGRSDARADYWLVERSGPARHGYRWTPDLRRRFDVVLEAIADGIGGGVYPPTPGEWDTWRLTNDACSFCEYDTVCLRSRGDQADAKRAAPELAVRAVLTDQVDVVEDGS